MADAPHSMPPATVLRTDQLHLRLVGPQDVAALTAYRNDPQVAALQDWELPYPRTQAEELIARHAGLTRIEPGRSHQIAIELAGQLVGDVYLSIDEHGGIATIGVTLARSAQGRGIGTEAVGALVDHVIAELGIHRIVADLSTQNVPSMRLLERIGMTAESTTRASYWWRGAWDDNLRYAMSAEDRRAWRERPRGAPGTVSLVPIDAANRAVYATLRVHHSQRHLVSSVVQSYADAFFPVDSGRTLVPVLFGIDADGIPAGFLMYADQDVPYLWRLLVDRAHQGRRIGQQVLLWWLEQMRGSGATSATVSWVPGPGSPEPFYRALGFVPTGELDEDGEIVARVDL